MFRRRSAVMKTAVFIALLASRNKTMKKTLIVTGLVIGLVVVGLAIAMSDAALIAKIKQRDPKPPCQPNTVEIQVTVWALNPQTNEIKEFGTGCQVTDGWIILTYRERDRLVPQR